MDILVKMMMNTNYKAGETVPTTGEYQCDMCGPDGLASMCKDVLPEVFNRRFESAMESQSALRPYK